MLKGLSLKAKLLALCVFQALVSVAVGVTSYVGMADVNQDFTMVSDISLPNTRDAGEMYLSFRRIRIQLRTLGLPGLTPEEANKSIHSVEEAIANYEAAKKRFEQVPFLPGEDELFKAVDSEWQKFKEIGGRVVSLYRSGKPEDQAKMMQIFFKDCPDSAAAYTAAIDKLIAFHDTNARAFVKEAHRSQEAANLVTIAMIGVGLVAGLGLGFALTRAIVTSIDTVTAGLAQGADHLAQSADQIASASHQLSASAAQQAASLQETTASVEETNSMIAKNAENAKQSTLMSQKSQEAAVKGKQAVEEMITSIDEISRSNTEIMQQIERSNQEISEIVRVISEIGSKTKVINDIVFQTKLLSFNASVEAARAGEAGKGFAVVAEEVGNLAQMSGNSAKEISQMLEESISKVEGIVANTKARVDGLVRVGKEKVQVGTETAQRCGQVLDEVVEYVGRVGHMVAEISTASQEQAQGVSEITKAVNELDQAALQNNTASQDMSTTATELHKQVLDIQKMVDRLNETVRGASTAAGPSVANVTPRENVVRFQAKKPVPTAAPSSQVKKAVGAHGIPVESDPGFRDF